MTNNPIIFLLAIAFCSCTDNQEHDKQVTNFELLEVSLLELQKAGLLNTTIPFNERSLKKAEIFPNGDKIPETIAGLRIVSKEEIFTSIDGISLKSITKKGTTYEIVFWRLSTESTIVVKLDSNLEILEIERSKKF